MNAPVLRIGDAERDAALAALAEHYAVGRLNKEEYDERSEQAWTARTDADLEPLFVDLPQPHAAPQPTPPAPSAWPRPRFGPPPFVPRVAFVALLVLLIIAIPGPPWPLLILAWFWFGGPRWGHRWGHRRMHPVGGGAPHHWRR